MFLYTGELCVRWRQQVCTKLNTPRNPATLTIISQKTLQPLNTSSKSISWIDSGPQVLAHDLGCDQNDGAVTVGFIKVFASPATGSSSISELFTNPGVQGGFR